MPIRKKLKKANDVTTKSGRVVKKPDREITQNCVLRSVSQANSVKRKKPEKIQLGGLGSFEQGRKRKNPRRLLRMLKSVLNDM